MYGRFVPRFLIGVLLVIGVFVLAGGAYQLGLSNGAASAGAAAPVVVHAWPGYWGWGGGFGILWIFFPILFFFLIFSLIRLAFWRGGDHGYGPGRFEHRGGWYGDRSAMFDEWHRRAHSQEGSGSGSAPGSGPTGGTGSGSGSGPTGSVS